ncbi:MAG: hypothetical protein AAGF88_03610 [Pseudomonadota bacterium]
MYADDSFFTLSGAGQVGLVLLSSLFAVVMLLLARALVRLPVALRLIGWLALLVAFISISPQGYYLYYRVIIDGLPAQWVLQPPLDAPELLRYLTFTGRTTLSAHSVGLLGWAMLAVAFLPTRHRTTTKS